MYIIDKKKDYYDGVVGTMGIDKEIVYERKTIEIKKNEEFPKEFKRFNDFMKALDNHFLNLDFYSPKNDSKYSEVDAFIVGFCGKLYPGFKFHKKITIKSPFEDDMFNFKTNIIYNRKKIKKHLENKTWGRVLEDDLNYIQNYDAMHIFREYNTPIFLYDGNTHRVRLNDRTPTEKFIVNPLLKDYEFYKVFDSFRAFQEIQMFISGVLGIGEKETVEISDINKIQQHGFDKKWSFRKEPTKKRKK